MRRFFSAVVGAVGESIQLDEEASHHLLRVSGIRPGETVGLFDGQGSACSAKLVQVDDGCAVLEIIDAVAGADGKKTSQTWLLQAILKQGTFDRVVRMATELGIHHLVPVLADRSVPRGDRSERWNRIAKAAVGQCGRSQFPVIHPVLSLEAALARVPMEVERRVLVPGAPRLGSTGGPVALLVGPEGGWSVAEIQVAVSNRCVVAGLGGLTLRADTAAAVALGSIRAPEMG